MSPEALLAALFLTAWAATLLFLLGFAGPALAALRPGALTRWLGARQRGFVLAFVAAHTVHLGFIGLRAASEGQRFVDEAGPLTLIGGALVYALVYGLGGSALRRERGAPLASRFEVLALYVVFAALLRPYLFRALEWRSPLYLPVALVLLAALAARLLAPAAAPDEALPPARRGLT